MKLFLILLSIAIIFFLTPFLLMAENNEIIFFDTDNVKYLNERIFDNNHHSINYKGWMPLEMDDHLFLHKFYLKFKEESAHEESTQEVYIKDKVFILENQKIFKCSKDKKNIKSIKAYKVNKIRVFDNFIFLISDETIKCYDDELNEIPKIEINFNVNAQCEPLFIKNLDLRYAYIRKAEKIESFNKPINKNNGEDISVKDYFLAFNTIDEKLKTISEIKDFNPIIYTPISFSSLIHAIIKYKYSIKIRNWQKSFYNIICQDKKIIFFTNQDHPWIVIDIYIVHRTLEIMR